MKRLILVLSLLMLAACSSADEGNNSNNGDDNNGGNNGTSNNGTNGESCGESQNAVVESIRAMPRECVSAEDCKIVPRAGTCECFNSVTAATSDVGAFEAALAANDAKECAHPFACSMPVCSYDSGFNPPVLIATCEEGKCGLAEVLACPDYEAGSKGGLVSPGACNTDADCTARSDLNPCGCVEGISVEFPALLSEVIYDMIIINRDRCNFVCDMCPAVTSAVCVDVPGSDLRECAAQ